MRRVKKLSGFFLALVFVFSLVLATPVTAKAYNYTVKISLGDKDTFEFAKDNLWVNDKSYSDIDSSNSNRLEIKGLNYGDRISFNINQLVTPKSGENKCYVKGVKVAGSDSVITPDAKGSIELKVQGDETYVAAYGVGTLVKYQVKYLDENKNPFPEYKEGEDFYGLKGQEVTIPAKNIDNYKPDAKEKTITVDGSDVVFFYGKLPPSTETVEKTTTVLVESEPTYRYERTGQDNTSTANTTNPANRNGVINNRRANAPAVAEEEAGEIIPEPEVPLAGPAKSGEEETSIDDDEVPKGIIDIPDEEIAGSENIFLNFIKSWYLILLIGIIILILVVLLIAKRKGFKATKE